MLFVVSGPSGVGKSTLCDRLLGELGELTLSISYTTRAPRGAEVDGVHYHFVDRARFDEMAQRGAFAEWAHVHGNMYGTARHVVDAELALGRSVLFDIDYQGAASLRSAYPEEAVTVMVLPPDMATLEARLRGRGTDTEDVVRRRLEVALNEIAHAAEFDFVVVNDSVESAYDALRSVFVSQKHATGRVWPSVRARFGA